jgi:hypothetical protein
MLNRRGKQYVVIVKIEATYNPFQASRVTVEIHLKDPCFQATLAQDKGV